MGAVITFICADVRADGERRPGVRALAHPLIAQLLHQEQRRCEDEDALAAERLHGEKRRVRLARTAGHDDLRATTIFQVLLDCGRCVLLEGEWGDLRRADRLGGDPVVGRLDEVSAQDELCLGVADRLFDAPGARAGVGDEHASREVLAIRTDELLDFARANGGVGVIAELRLDGDESPCTVFSDEVHAPLDARQARLGASRPLLPAPALHEVWMPASVDPAHQSCLPGRPLGRAVREGADLRLQALQGCEIGSHGAILGPKRANRLASQITAGGNSGVNPWNRSTGQ